MSDQAVDLPIEVSNDQVDKFFAGEDAGLPEDVTPEVIPEPTPEPVEAELEVKPEPEAPRKTVPLEALHEERQRRKEMQAEMQRIQEQNKLMEERFRLIQERLQPQAPKFDEDPLGALKHQNEELARQAEEYKTRFSQMDERQQMEEQRNRFVSRYQQEAKQFAAETPDFPDAYKFLIESRMNELNAVGYSPQEVEMLIQQEEAMLVGKSFEDGANPGERVYKMAQARGYHKPAPAAPEVPVVDSAAKMDALQKGQQAAASLSAVAGKGSEGVTLEMLSTLEGAEFDKYWEKLVGPNR